LPGQYPEIGGIRTGHQRIAVALLVEIDDVIATVEGATAALQVFFSSNT